MRSRIRYEVPVRFAGGGGGGGGGEEKARYIEVTGFMVEPVGDADGLRFGVHKQYDGMWIVSELSSGLKVCDGTDEEDACGKFREMVSDELGVWTIREMLKRWDRGAVDWKKTENDAGGDVE